VDNFPKSQLEEVGSVGGFPGEEGPSAASGLQGALVEAEAAGILPITSTCDISCLFCSNRSNPPGARVYALRHRPVSEIARALAGMARLPEIVIGEAASRVSEGEPLTHPDFSTVARLVRQNCPDATIRLTTNGRLLDAGLTSLLAALGPVEVTLSLNTASTEAYGRLHGRAGDPRRAARLLAASGLGFEASVVAVPAVTGAGDLQATASFLADQGCTHCRVFIPGFTRFTPASVRAVLPEREEVTRLVEEARATRMPLSLEPPQLGDLEARVTGILAGTPAERAGLRAGDVVTAVEGTRPFSRVDAFRRCQDGLRSRGRCRVRLARLGEAEVTLAASDDHTGAPREPVGRGRPGFVMDRDCDPDDARTILELADGLGASRAVVFTGSLAARVMELGLASAAREHGGRPAWLVAAVPSETFGGSIGAAGLLTVEDVATELGRHDRLRPGDVLFLPPVAFDRNGVDLMGRSATEIRCLLPRRTRLVVPGLTL
jgi:pyruvate-formate lyase-activating enzyme